jgi:hypothetical protein
MSSNIENNFLTYKHLGRIGRLGNHLWQICGTLGSTQQYNDIHNTNYQMVFPKWQHSYFFSFPEEWFVDKETIKNSHNLFKVIKQQHSYCVANVEPVEYIKDKIQQWLKPSPLGKAMLEPKIEKYNPENKTSIHIRRGDYETWCEGKNLLPQSYYEKIWPNEEVLIFSDDPQWCKENFPGYEVVNNEPVIDLALMRMCKSHIVANSTFSWWGAYGSSNVTAPAPWLKHIDLEKMIPSYWKRSSWC